MIHYPKWKFAILASWMLVALSLSVHAQTTPPKNILFFIADGWSYQHIAATDYFSEGDKDAQVYADFPVRYALSTYLAAYQPKDKSQWVRGSYEADSAWTDFQYVKRGYTGSAEAATAMSTGTRTLSKMIGLDPTGRHLLHFSENAVLRKKSSGLITSVQWTHATPAGFSAHNALRSNYSEIAREMLLDTRLRVIMGAGHPQYDKNGDKLAAGANYDYVGGEDSWKALRKGYFQFNEPSPSGNRVVQDVDGDGLPDPWKLIETREDFIALQQGETPQRVLGTAQVSKTLQQERRGDAKAAPFAEALIQSVPSLEEMFRGAVNVLNQDEDGFFLMVEGGAVDWASHNNESGRMIEEMMAFNAAVEAAVEWINAHGGWEENLLIVTGDHECGYLTGLKEAEQHPATNPIVNRGKGEMPLMRWNSDSHTNQLIPFYAKGAGSEAFASFLEGEDPVRGPILNNTGIAKALFLLWSE